MVKILVVIESEGVMGSWVGSDQMAPKRKVDKVARLYIMFFILRSEKTGRATPGPTVHLQVRSSEPESLMRPQPGHSQQRSRGLSSAGTITSPFIMMNRGIMYRIVQPQSLHGLFTICIKRRWLFRTTFFCLSANS
jgi:hypothetical protein